MYEIVKKIDNQKYNSTNFLGSLEEFGLEQVTVKDMISSPCLISITPQHMSSKMISGVVLAGMQAARVKTPNDKAAGLNVQDVPINFLSIKSDSLITSEDMNVLAHDIFIEIEKQNGSKLVSIDVLEKYFRNLNFFTYCNGLCFCLEFEEALKKEMESIGYLKDDISMSLNQIAVVDCFYDLWDEGRIPIRESDLTIISFVDINEEELIPQVREGLKSEFYNEVGNDGFIASNLKENIGFIWYDGTGEHKLSKYLRDDNTIKLQVVSTVSGLINNSLQNSKNEDFVRISKEDIIQNMKSVCKSMTINEFDRNLQYTELNSKTIH